MTMPFAGQAFPKTNVPKLGGGTLTLGTPRGDHGWQMVVVYRGQHCPICKSYLGKLDAIKGRFHDLGVEVVVVSGDSEVQAQAMKDDVGFDLPTGYGLSIEQMRAMGLYVSEPRSPDETDHPFPEPGIFVINDAGNIQIIDVSNAPFARPDLDRMAKGIGFIIENGYPVRGTHRAA